jgi:hypothetical protein
MQPRAGGRGLPSGVGAADVPTTGAHVRKDLPLPMDPMRRAHPGVEFSLHPAVAEMPASTAAMAGVARRLLAAEGAPGI